MKDYNRDYTIGNKSIIAIIVIALSPVIYFAHLENKHDEKILNQVKSGELILSCALNGDWQKSEVSPKLVTDYSAQYNKWTFINGSAENCKLKQKEE